MFQIWSKRNTNIASVFIIIFGAFLQSCAFFGDGPHYLENFSGCTYGNFIGTNIAVTKVIFFGYQIYFFKITLKTQGVTAGITAITCITFSIATIVKLNILRRNGTISQQHKREIPLLGKNKDLILKKFSVYSVTLTSLETILAVAYVVNDQALLTGGNIFNQIYGWTVFLYMLAPSILLFVTRLNWYFEKNRSFFSKNVRYCYLSFYLPKKWSYKWNSSQVISLPTTS